MTDKRQTEGKYYTVYSLDVIDKAIEFAENPPSEGYIPNRKSIDFCINMENLNSVGVIAAKEGLEPMRSIELTEPITEINSNDLRHILKINTNVSAYTFGHESEILEAIKEYVKNEAIKEFMEKHKN